MSNHKMKIQRAMHQLEMKLLKIWQIGQTKTKSPIENFSAMHQLDQTFPQEQNQRDLLIMTLSPHASGETAWDQSNEISTITPEKPLV